MYLQDGNTLGALDVAASSKDKLDVIIKNHADSEGNGVRDSVNGDVDIGGGAFGSGGGGGDVIKIPNSIPISNQQEI